MSKVIIGLSGGVDSAVAAYLLKQQGHEVVGCFMRNWDSFANNDILGNKFDTPICPQEMDYNDAKRVAEIIGIPLLRVDFIKEYWDEVFTYFIEEYKKGRTPNPDVLCNKYIKFDAFLKFCKQQGCDYIATGHYVKKIGNKLYKAHDENKDQSYFLCLLNQQQIDASLFPLGDIDKPTVRKIAHELNLNVADKKDSTGICFIGERDFRKFLQNYIPAKEGNIVDIDTGDVIGTHIGVMYYTLGQRKGLGIGGLKNHKQGSWFVVDKDIEKRILYVAQGDEAKYLYHSHYIIKDVNWLGEEKNYEFKEINAKFRYRQKDHRCKYRFIDETTIEVETIDPAKATTPGQMMVGYEDDGHMLFGGVIDSID